MFMQLGRGLVVFLALLSSAVSASAQPVKLVATEIPKLVEGPNEGLFVLLTKEVAKRVGVEVEIEVLPGLRSLDSFLKGGALGLFPAVDAAHGHVDAVRTSPMYIKRDFGFVREGVTPPRSVADLSGLKVGLTSAYKYHPSISENSQIQIEMAATDIQNMQKLAAGRIDVFVVEEQSGLAALQQAGGKGVAYDTGAALIEDPAYYIFQNTPEGSEMAARFSKVLEEMVADGSLQAILSGQR